MSAPTYRIPAPQAPLADPAAAPMRSSVPTSRATFLRRRVLAVLAVVLLALVLVLTGSAMQAEAGGGGPVSAGHVVVQPGQSLWDIAAANTPADRDVRDYLLALEQLNGVRAHAVDAWDVLLLPVLR